MTAPKRKIVLTKRPATLTFTEDEQPTAPYRSRPPEIRRSSGTRAAVRVDISNRPTARPPSSGVAPAISTRPPELEPVLVAQPALPQFDVPVPPSSGEVVATWAVAPAPAIVALAEEEETPTVPRARRRERGWGGPIVIAMLLVACEIAIAHWPRVLSMLVGE